MKRLSWVLSAVSAVAMTLVVIFVAPDTIAMHFGFSGQADLWGSKWWYLFIAVLPLILAASYALYCEKTKGNEKVSRNRRMEDRIVPVLPLIFIAIGWMMLIPSMGGEGRLDLGIGCGVVVLLGALMIYISNYSGKIAQNRYFGVKTPWTLKDETVWNKTHRLGGVTGVIGGCLAMLGGVIGAFTSPAWAMAGIFAGIVLVALVPFVYSYALYQKRHKGDQSR